jgi:YD repeat-containing protein
VPIYVVSLIEDQTYNSITDYRTVYSFGFPRYHLLGRGFLGFDEVNKFDPQNGLTDIQAFSINTNYYFPFLTSHLIQTSNHTIISSDENLFEFRTLGQATFFPYIATNLHKKRDLNNSFISTQKSSFDYDDHGNLTFKEILYDPNDLNINSANSDYDFSDKLLTSYNLFDNIIWLPILVEEIYKLTGEDEIDKKQSFEYFPLGNPHFPLVKQIQINIVPPNNPLCLQTTYDYDDYGNIIYIKKSAPFALDPKPLDRVTTFEYNSDYQSRFPTKKTLDPDGINLEFYSQFDPIFGLISSSIDCNQLSHKFYYDAFGNLWKEEFPDGSIFQTVSRWASGNSYAPSGALYYRWSKNTGQGEEITFFDKFANEVRDVSRSLNYSVIYSDYEYDSFRRLSKSSLPYFPGSTIYYTEYSYDILDRIVQKIYPNTSQESTVYNGNETLTTISSTTLPSQTSIKIINPMGWTVRSVDADQIEIIFEYTSNGLVKNTYISGNTSTSITQEYDVNDNCVTLVDPNTKEINFTYNAFNELVSKIDNIGHHSISTYDALGRIIRLDEVEGLTHWYYDNSTKQKALGKIDRILNSNESREFFYDELGRIEFVDEQINGDPEVSEFMRKYDSYSRINLINSIQPQI